MNADGTFLGTGHFTADPSYTRDLGGTISGDTAAWAITYRGSEAGFVYTGRGTISADGSLRSDVSRNVNGCTEVTTGEGVFLSTPDVTPTAALTASPVAASTPTVTPEPTIRYECPWVTIDEITAITGRPVLAAFPQGGYEEQSCLWQLGPKPDEPADYVTVGAFGYGGPWDEDFFDNQYRAVPPDWREPDVGEGALWTGDQELWVLLDDGMYWVKARFLSSSEQENRRMAIAIAEAAIPRL